MWARRWDLHDVRLMDRVRAREPVSFWVRYEWVP